MGIFGIFKKKKEVKKEVYELGQVGSNPNQKLVRKENGNLFIQEKGFMGKMTEVPIKKEQTETTETTTGEIKNEE